MQTVIIVGKRITTAVIQLLTKIIGNKRNIEYLNHNIIRRLKIE